MSGRPLISVVTPTQRRPAPLRKALDSVLAQTGIDPARIELVVADNDAVPSARAAVEALAARAPFPVRYVHEPRPGVASVRNAALGVAKGGLIAFLDDDEEAPPRWLAELEGALERFDADVVFGPVRARAPQATAHRDYLERFFSRLGPEAAGPIGTYYGCGNSMIRRAVLPDPRRPFSAERNRIGGEDDLLFAALAEGGARFAWAPEAFVWEDPAPERLTLGYAIRRAFAFGQGPTSASAAAARPLGVAYWMLVGLGPFAVFGALAAVKWVLKAPDRADALDRAARGLGKTLWGGPFKIAFYGLPAAPGRSVSHA